VADYVERQLAERVNTNQLVGDIVEQWHRLAEGRKTVIFATGVPHSLHIRDELRRSGVWAEHIDGTTATEEREAILSASRTVRSRSSPTAWCSLRVGTSPTLLASFWPARRGTWACTAR
jgi:superfamily II DNA or RNA helicase